MESVRFDRAVEYYDRTRALEPVVMAEIVAAHAAEFEGFGPTLEIGVGTGRFALPLRDAGVEMVGLDLSRPMMEKLREKAGGKSPFPLVEGDATKLPFASDAFGSALVVHVFHLIPNWHVALNELLRVMRSGGRLVMDFGDKGGGAWDDLWEVYGLAAKLDKENIGVRDPDEVHRLLLEKGARERPVQGFTETRTWRFGEIIGMLEDGIFSATWRTDDEGRRVGAEAARQWVTEQGHALSDTFETHREIQWRAYELP
jgi:SAM-dependent methyltransferase